MRIKWYPWRRIRLDQNWIFMHRGEKGDGSNFRLFADVMNPYKLFFAIEYYFCCFSLHSLLFHSFFDCFCMLSKRDNHNLKKDEGEQF